MTLEDHFAVFRRVHLPDPNASQDVVRLCRRAFASGAMSLFFLDLPREEAGEEVKRFMDTTEGLLPC